MSGHKAIFICNAFEDRVRIKRGIYSDSPAASKKTIQMSLALKRAGVRTLILSMGRGKAGSSSKYFPMEFSRANGVLILYAPHLDFPVLSEILSLISLPILLLSLRRKYRCATTIFYNRTSAYIPTLFTSIFCRFSRVLDLEDQELFPSIFSLNYFWLKLKQFLYDQLCTKGVILACQAIAPNNKSIKRFCYYGAVEDFIVKSSWTNNKIVKILLCGTIDIDTGALSLIEAIKSLKQRPEKLGIPVEFIITGKGAALSLFEELALDFRGPRVTVKRHLTDSEYRRVLEECQIGLSLKPPYGELADTTFPSKVIELASYGLLVIATNISDVKVVLGSGAIYLEDGSGESLLSSICWVTKNLEISESISKIGQARIKSHCDINLAGRKLKNFLF